MAQVKNREVRHGSWTPEAGSRLRELRTERSLSQKSLGEPLITSGFMSLLESGARQPSRKVLEHLSSRLGVDVDELVTGRPAVREAELELRLQEARELMTNGRLGAAEAIARDVASSARSNDLIKPLAKSTEVLAALQEKSYDYDAALNLYKEAERIWAGESPHLAFQAIVGVARCTQIMGDVRMAIHILEHYLLDLDSAGVLDPTALLRVYSTLSLTYSAAGLPKKASESAEKAMELAPRVPDPEQIACMNMNVARSLLDRGRDDEALVAIRNAENAFLSLGWEIDAARAEINKGIVQAEKGDTDDARASFTHAIEVLKRMGRPEDTGSAMNELGRLERLAGNLDRAKVVLREAASLIPERESFATAWNVRELGFCLAESDDPEGERLLDRAVSLFRQAGSSIEVGRTFKMLGEIQRRRGKLEDSTRSFEAAFEAADEAWRNDNG